MLAGKTLFTLINTYFMDLLSVLEFQHEDWITLLGNELPQIEWFVGWLPSPFSMVFGNFMSIGKFWKLDFNCTGKIFID